VNLVRNYTPEEAHHLLNSSFAQFQADRGVVALERQLERDRAFLSGYLERITCHLGDFQEYWSLRERAEDIRRDAARSHDRGRQDVVRAAMAHLRPGDVVFVPRASRRGLAVVLSNRDGRPTLLTQDRRFFRAALKDFEGPPMALAKIRLPKSGSARSARYRRDLAARLVELNLKPPKPRRERLSPEALARAEELDRRAEQHPCHTCPDRGEHERWAARASHLLRQVRGLERRIRARTETLARQFDRVLDVLEALGYVDGWTLTPKGRTLSRIYGEGDLLVGESLAGGLFDDLSPSELASILSSVVYESRERVASPGEMPTGTTEDRYETLSRTYRRIRRTEEEHQVELSRTLDAGFATPVFHWAEGQPLERVLEETEMAPGDFVRNCKQLVDLLRQIEEVAEPRTAGLLRDARAAVLHGVVAYTGV
jgi:ATP-dependent RNA helicase HelY